MNGVLFLLQMTRLRGQYEGKMKGLMPSTVRQVRHGTMRNKGPSEKLGVVSHVSESCVWFGGAPGCQNWMNLGLDLGMGDDDDGQG